MAEPSPASKTKWRTRMVFGATIVLSAAATFLLTLFLMNISDRKREAQEHFLKLVDLDEDTIDPAIWGRNFPRQYDGYKRTAINARTGHGGSEGASPSKLEADPFLRRMFAGYAFSIDYREKRGHAYMLADQEKTERVTKKPQPGACLHCHASILPVYRAAGAGDVMKGFEKVCAMAYQKAHDLKDENGKRLIQHPVACIDCHDPKTMQLRVTRPGFINGIKALANSEEDLPHMPSVMQWRRDHPKKTRKAADVYDVNALASRQEMRSFACGQCHVEYYFKGEGKVLTYPWHNGLKADQIESYYDKENFTDWVHAETKAPMLKAQHPEFEMRSQGIHARSGVACADCHMPYKREGAVKISDHQVRSPMLNVARACQTCHRYPEEEIQSRVKAIQGRTRSLIKRAEKSLEGLMDAMKDARKRAVPEKDLAEAQGLHRKAQWRLDFVISENSRGFHAPQEACRLLAEAIDFARQGQISALGRK